MHQRLNEPTLALCLSLLLLLSCANAAGATSWGFVTTGGTTFSVAAVCRFVGSVLYNGTTRGAFDGEMTPVRTGPLLPNENDAIRCLIPTVTGWTVNTSEVATERYPHRLMHSNLGSIVGSPYTRNQEDELCYLGCSRILYEIIFAPRPAARLRVLAITRPFAWDCWLPVDIPSARDQCLRDPANAPAPSGSGTSVLGYRLLTAARKARAANAKWAEEDALCRALLAYALQRGAGVDMSAQQVSRFTGDRPRVLSLSQRPRCGVQAVQPTGQLEARAVRRTGRDETCALGCDVVRYTVKTPSGVVEANIDVLFMRLCTPAAMRPCAPPLGFLVQRRQPSRNPPLPTTGAPRLPVSAVQTVVSPSSARRLIINRALAKLTRRQSFSVVVQRDVRRFEVKHMQGRRYRVIVFFRQKFAEEVF